MDGFVNIHTHRPAPGEIAPSAAGIHPWLAERLCGTTPEEALPQIDTAQAVGEIGLDYARGPEAAVQLAALRAQLRLARERDLPVVLHCVRAFEPLMRELDACEPRAVIFHGFVGSPEQARKALSRGYFLSFGVRTFASPRTLEALRATPLDRLFVETDEDPGPIAALYARVAAARGVTVGELRSATLGNYERIFGKLDNG